MGCQTNLNFQMMTEVEDDAFEVRGLQEDAEADHELPAMLP